MAKTKSGKEKCRYCGLHEANPDYYFEVRIKKNDKKSHYKIPCCKECKTRVSNNLKNTLLKYIIFALILGGLLFWIFYNEKSSTTRNIEKFVGSFWLSGWLFYLPCIISYKRIIEYKKFSENEEWQKLEYDGRDITPR